MMHADLLKILSDGMPSFSKGQKRLAVYLSEHYEKAAYLTAKSLGEAVGVSESTVVRFAGELGYDGYPELQNALQSLIRSSLTSFERMEVSNTLIGESEVPDKVLLADIDKIRNTLEGLDRVTFEAAVNAISNANKIYILGVRSSSALAGFLNYNFRMIFDHVRLVQTTSGSEMFEEIMQIQKGDVMVAISFPRYSKRIINAVEYAKSREAAVVALTDSALSPIASTADHVLVAQSDMVSFVDSLVAPLSLINALIVAVARKKQDEVSERLRILEEVWDKYDVYDKKGT